jgi:2,3-bisphosphoglycerate-independent phosphoglycerate mutase
MSLGIRALDVAGATGAYDTDLAAKAAAACGALVDRHQGSEFLLLHVKAVDDAGHDRAVALKVL